MDAPRAWVLNFDAEEELAALTPGARWRPPARSAAAAAKAEAARALLTDLLVDGDVVVDEVGTRLPRSARGWRGRAWCPTPSALARLEAAGALPPRAPSAEVLRLVNHRRFCWSLGGGLPGAVYAEDLETVIRAVAVPSVGGDWLLKRPLGFAGRGRIGVSPGRLSDAATAFCVATLRSGDGLSVEPWVRRLADFSLHGYLSSEGELTVGQPVRQTIGSTGAFQSAEPAPSASLEDGELRALEEALRSSADALRGARYFGPFGIDAFRWARPDGGAELLPRCEINARYSMAWAIGMGSARPDLADPS